MHATRRATAEQAQTVTCRSTSQPSPFFCLKPMRAISRPSVIWRATLLCLNVMLSVVYLLRSKNGTASFGLVLCKGKWG